MRLRRDAAVVGAALITAVVLAFSLAQHSAVAGSNGIHPLYQTLHLRLGTWCEPLPRVPAQTSRLEVKVLRTTGAARALRIDIADARGRPLAAGSASGVAAGTVAVDLDPLPPRRGTRHAWLCLTNPRGGEIVFLGETKNCVLRPKGTGLPAPCFRRTDKPRDKLFRWGVAVRFLRSGSTNWLSQAGLILDRFGFSQAGWFGRWAAWVAALLGAASAALALWWLGRQPRTDR